MEGVDGRLASLANHLLQGKDPAALLFKPSLIFTFPVIRPNYLELLYLVTRSSCATCCATSAANRECFYYLIVSQASESTNLDCCSH